MEIFDKRMMLEVIEDALEDAGTPRGRGVATGLCGAFHMCGMLSEEEWEAYLKRIPAEPHKAGGNGIRSVSNPGAKGRGRMLN